MKIEQAVMAAGLSFKLLQIHNIDYLLIIINVKMKRKKKTYFCISVPAHRSCGRAKTW